MMGSVLYKKKEEASLVVQVLILLLTVQGTRLNPWSRKIPIGCGAAGAHVATTTGFRALEPASLNKKTTAKSPQHN